MKTFIESERLIIKEPSVDDMNAIFQLDSDKDVMEFIGNGARTYEEVSEKLKKTIAHYEKHGFSFGSVFEKESGKFIGRAGLFYLAYDDSQPDIEVGYRLHKNFWGKGYATELGKSIINWGFHNLPIKKLVAVIFPGNTRSQHVVEKLGMQYIGKSKYYNFDVDRYEIYKK